MFRYKSLKITVCGRLSLNFYNGISYKSSPVFFSVKSVKSYLSYKKFNKIIEKKATPGIAYKKKYLNG